MELLLSPLNRAIMAEHEAGMSGILYQAWIVVVYIVVAVFCLVYRRHYGYGWFRSLLIPLLLLLTLNIFILLLGWALTGFTFFGTKNIVEGFCFVPFMVMGYARLLKDDRRRMLDFMTPAFPLTQAVAKVSCCFVGCCFGYPARHGIWNPIFSETLFPVQLLEAAVALAVCIVCVLVAKKQDYRVTGRLYPVFLILFGGTRFFLEFLRLNPKRIWGISDLALWALLMILVGTAWLLCGRDRKGPKPKTKKR